MNLNTKIERAIVTALVTELAASGFVPVKVWDGGEYVDATTLDEVLDAAFSVDESTVHFAEAGARDVWGRRGVFLVCGNGIDIISDYHVGTTAWSEAIRRVTDRVENITVSA